MFHFLAAKYLKDVRPCLVVLTFGNVVVVVVFAIVIVISVFVIVIVIVTVSVIVIVRLVLKSLLR